MMKTNTILELTVKNHSGVMMHVCSLFARRVFNVDGILCLPTGDASKSRLWLRVKEDLRLEQMILQLQKLEDVLDVRRHGASHAVFERVGKYFRE
ncbi:MAG: acetolactate synthase small subunit [Opitutaceae bacterium]|nr:acetolactate synthase small subunit [Opitutaceae bacterium]